MANKSRHMIYSLGHSKSFGKLSLKAKVLWPMLIAEADDQGRHDGDIDVIKWGVCQNVNEIPVDDIPSLLEEMQSLAMVLVYEADGPLMQILNWWEYQTPAYARPSRWPAPEGWTDRIHYRSGDHWVSVNWDHPGGYAQPLDKPIGNPTPSARGYPSDKVKEGKVRQGKVKEEAAAAKPFSQIFTEILGVLVATGEQAEKMDGFMGEIPEEWFRAACTAAVDNNARKWAYVRAICQRCRDEGRAPGEGKRGKHSRRDLTPEQIAQREEFDRVAQERQRERDAEYVDA